MRASWTSASLFMTLFATAIATTSSDLQWTHTTYTSGPPLGDAPEPYLPIHAGSFDGPAVPLSPDPMVTYKWNSGGDQQSLQLFTMRPKSTEVLSGNVVGLDSFSLPKPNPKASVTIGGSNPPVSIRLDFGVEVPAWLEFDSLDFGGVSKVSATLAVGEYFQPWQSGATTYKLGSPKQYNTTYRLETNAELYEGVRFAFLNFESTSTTSVTFSITGLRLVVQTKPVNYEGSFHSSDDPMLESVWWVAAWTVRSNLLKDYFGSILMDRGDREAWTGDAHPSQAAALVSFHNLDFIKQNIASSIHGSGAGFPTYQCYWVLSILDYFNYSGDVSILTTYAIKMEQLLSPLAISVLAGNRLGLGFVGWDDRTGAGFSNSSCVECENDLRMILLRTVNESGHAYKSVNASLSQLLLGYSGRLTTLLRSPTKVGDVWWSQLLLASAGDAINAGLATVDEGEEIFKAYMNDSITICQLSPFNTYWTLQALGRLGKTEQALFVLRNCYGGMIASGATTFWETFANAPEYISGDMPWIHNTTLPSPSYVPWTWSGITSLCHPWSAGPAYWMSQNLLGVKPLSPGFSKFEIAPMLGASLRQINGVVPTVLGAFEVSFNMTSRRARVVIPEGAVGRVGLPLEPHLSLTTVIVNGNVVVDINVADVNDGDGSDVAYANKDGVGVGGGGGGGGGDGGGGGGAGGGVDGVGDNAAGAVHGSATTGTARFHFIHAVGEGVYDFSWSVVATTTTHNNNDITATTHNNNDNDNTATTHNNINDTTSTRNNNNNTTTTTTTHNNINGSPAYAPPTYKASFLGRDDVTSGNWIPTYGKLGYHLFNYCSSEGDHTCQVASEPQSVTLTCGHSVISNVSFAEFGLPTGDCDRGLSVGSCGTILTDIITRKCKGSHSCTIQCSFYTSLHQHGCNISNGNTTTSVDLPDPCGAVAKRLAVAVTCAGHVTCKDSLLPAFVTTITNAYGRGTLGSFGTPAAANDTRALVSPVGATTRNIGKLSEGVIVSVDIHVSDPNQEYQLSAYFVDWERQGRVNYVSLLNATDSTFDVIAPSQLVRDFREGVYLRWKVRGSVRIRCAHVGGMPGGVDVPISAIFFDDSL